MVHLGNRRIGDSEPCFITFEAGSTHSGLSSAKELVSLAAKTGADAIKFQIIDPERIVADKKQLFSYQVLVDREANKTETVEEPLYDILSRRALSREDWIEVKKHSDQHGLAFFATIGFEDEIELLEEIKCDSIKIASADVNYWPLIRRAARTGMNIQLDTGNATIGEIEEAVDVVLSEGNENIIIHNCPSGYPARLESINLNLIPTLKRIFPYPVAFSDHTPGWEIDIAAVAMGANLIEKTITIDRTTRSVEHIFSLEPEHMKQFITAIRNIEIALGSNRRVLNPQERINREKVRRSAYLKNPVIKGQLVADAEVEFQRPGFGISPDIFETLINMRFTKNMPKGSMITFGDLE